MRAHIAAAALLLFACQNKSSYKEAADSASLNDTTSIYTNNPNDVKLVKTAQIRLKVTDVEASSKAVSQKARRLGGMIFRLSLQSQEGASQELKLSDDSLLVIQTVTPIAELTVRVPSDSLETFLYQAAEMGYFTKSSELHIDDKSLAFVENGLRGKHREDVLKGRVPTRKAPGTQEAIAIGDAIITQQIANRMISADAAYSLVDLQLYQNALVKKEVVANTDIDGYVLPFRERLRQSLEQGWNGLLAVTLALVSVWWLWVFGAIIWLAYRRVFRIRWATKS